MCSQKVKQYTRRKLDENSCKSNKKSDPFISVFCIETTGTTYSSTASATSPAPTFNKVIMQPSVGHSLRFGNRKGPAFSKAKCTKPKQVIPKTVFLLAKRSFCEDKVEEDDEYVPKDEMILMKGEFDLDCGVDKGSICSELKDMFWRKFLFISEKNLDFVRRDRNIISTPVMKGEHCWDYVQMKHLCGVGKFYMRLNVRKVIISDQSQNSDDDGLQHMLPSTSCGANGNSGAHPEVITVDADAPSSSSGKSFMDTAISTLRGLILSATQS